MEFAGSTLTLNPLAILAAAMATFLIGGLWYSPMLFDRPWRALNGLTEVDMSTSGPLKVFGLSFLAALVAAIILAFFLGSPDVTLGFAILAGALVGVGWVATSMLTTYLFERRLLRLWLIDAGYHAVAFSVMGAILGVWR